MDDNQKLINEKIVLVLYRIQSEIDKHLPPNVSTDTRKVIDSIYDLIHNNQPAQRWAWERINMGSSYNTEEFLKSEADKLHNLAYKLEEAAEVLETLRTKYDAEMQYKNAMKRAKSWAE